MLHRSIRFRNAKDRRLSRYEIVRSDADGNVWIPALLREFPPQRDIGLSHRKHEVQPPQDREPQLTAREVERATSAAVRLNGWPGIEELPLEQRDPDERAGIAGLSIDNNRKRPPQGRRPS